MSAIGATNGPTIESTIFTRLFVNAPISCSTTHCPAFKTFLTAPVIKSVNASFAPSSTLVAAQNTPSTSF